MTLPCKKGASLVKLRLLRAEIIPNYLGGPNVTTGIPERQRRQERQRSRGWSDVGPEPRNAHGNRGLCFLHSPSPQGCPSFDLNPHFLLFVPGTQFATFSFDKMPASPPLPLQTKPESHPRKWKPVVSTENEWHSLWQSSQERTRP